MEYLLKASAVSIIFYLCYKVFLQRDTFFGHNRWFLLVGLFTSFIIPFIIIPIYIEYTPVNLSEYTFSNTTDIVQNMEQPFNFLDYLPIVYGIGVVFFAVKFLIQLASLSLIIFKNKREKQGCYTFVKTTNKISPFSFFNWIVYNPNEFNKTELAQIITHEKVHTRQYHSVDILLTQLACVVLWFNPIIWLYNKDIKQNLEFIADHEAQQKFNSKKSYQTTLLKTSMPSHQMALSNNFYNSLIKKRIVMLHKSKSKKINLLKYLLIIPLIAGFLMSFNTQEIYVEKKVNTLDNQSIEVIIDKNTTNEALELIKDKFKEACNSNFYYYNLKRNIKGEIISIDTELKNKFGKVETSSENENGIIPYKIYYNKNNDTYGTHKVSDIVKNYPVNQVEKFIIEYHFSNEKLKTFEDNLKNKGFDFNLKEIERNSKNQITSIDFTISKNKVDGDYRIFSGEPLGNIIIEYSEARNKFKINTSSFIESERELNSNSEVIEIVINKNTTSEFLENKKKFLSSKYNLDFTFKIIERNVDNEITKFNYKLDNGITNTEREIGPFGTIDPIIIKYNPRTKQMLSYFVNQNGDPEYGDITYLDKQKSYAILKHYTDESLSKSAKHLKENGVTVKFSKVKRNKKGEITGINIHATSKTGSTVTFDKFSNNPIDQIAISYYGDGDAVKIGPSNFLLNKKDFNNTLKQKDSTKIGKTMSDVKVIGYGNKDGKIPLYIVDGKEVTKEAFEKLSPDEIHSVTVLKDKAATSVYENRGENGVILITTKKEHSKNKSVNNKNLSEITAIATTPTNKISLNTKDGKDPLYIVDGKETSKNEFDKISSEKVKSIHILKDEQAAKKYGDKAKNGIVEITIKK